MGSIAARRRQRNIGMLGLGLLIFALLFYGGLHAWRHALQNDVKQARFEQQLDEQKRRHGRWAQVTRNSPRAAGSLVTARQLIKTLTPTLLGAAVLGAILATGLLFGRESTRLPPGLDDASEPVSRQGVGTGGEPGASEPLPRSTANAPADRATTGGPVVMLTTIGLAMLIFGGGWSLSLNSGVEIAKRLDQRDLESRTVRGVPSPYGGKMTVTYGGKKPARADAAQGNKEAYAPLALTILGCGVGSLVLAGLFLIANRGRQARAAAASRDDM
jgi:hypothetical protein